jgi:hypothetical protein
MVPAKYPPKIPRNPENIARIGNVIVAANTFGKTK